MRHLKPRGVDDILNSLLHVDEKKVGASMVLCAPDAHWAEFRKKCADRNIPSKYVESYIEGVMKWAKDTVEETS